MLSWFAGVRALAGLSITEAMRQRLWLLLLAGVAVVLASAPSLRAVDGAARLKLAVVVITAAIGFIAVLMAVFVAATALRRDLDARTAFVLFSKPLPRSAYLVGRWAGVLAALLIGTVVLCAVGTAAIAWQFGGLPAMRAAVAPAAWEQVSAFGQAIPIDAARTRTQLSGAVGNGVRFHLTGLSGNPGPAGFEVLLKGRVRSYDPDQVMDDLLVQVTALPSAGQAWPPRVLALDAQSPYGSRRGGEPVPAGQVALKDRDESRTDLAQDYLRLRLPAECIGADGSALLQITRLEARAALVFARADSLRVAVDGGNLFLNLVRGGLVLLASAGLIAAWTLFCAVLSSLGVTALGGLTLYFAGSALGVMREVLSYNDTGTGMRRLLELALTVIPDFSRYDVAAQLAASEAVGWATVGAAWAYNGVYIGIFLVLAWVGLARREL